ncbi:Alpha/Beta hydrolase protein [Xylariaceae sp. FL0804]|nr:Alpha/Beta hydrolase protein [Xylariaceae sp. FL0804]
MSSDEQPTHEGEIPFAIPGVDKPCATWYKVVGDLSSSSSSDTADTTKPAVVVLHGGPGGGHDSLVPLAALHARHGLPVVFYDQVGCGRSTRLRERAGDESLWTAELFVRELDNLIDGLPGGGLRLRGFHLVGHSWGGMLAGQYAARRPDGLRRVVMSGAPASIPLYNRGARRRIAELPEGARKVLESDDVDHGSAEYKEATAVFMRTFVCRLDPVPLPAQQTWKNIKEDSTVYGTMQGESEFASIGTLRDWEGWKEAHQIEAETLLINGRYDEVMDFVMAPWFQHIPKVKWVTLENASHSGLWEAQERYLQLCGDFLTMEEK